MLTRMVCVAAVLAIAQGSGSARAADIKPFISEQVSPLEVIVVKDRDGHELPAVVRRPLGRSGPCPAFVFFHGGLNQMSVDSLKKGVADPLETLFLAEGYVVVQATYRSRAEDPQRPETVSSAVAVLDAVKKLRGVDPKSVVVSGSSGGGSLALEVAAETDLAAIAPFEPATVIFTGMMNHTNRVGTTEDPQRYWTPEIQQKTRERISRLRCPVFVGHGNVNGLKKINFEIFFPELLKASKPVQINLYPGTPHSILGFYYPNRMEFIKSFFEDCNGMFKRYLATQPVPVDRSVLQWVEDTPPKTDEGARTIVDLRKKPTIGLEDPPAPGETPVGSFRTRVLRLTIFLPAGSKQGEYEVQILRAAAPILSLGGVTTFDDDRNLVLELKPDLTGYELGRHVLGIRSANGKWTFYPIILRRQV
jgi:acetyl esterase/lipase